MFTGSCSPWVGDPSSAGADAGAREDRAGLEDSAPRPAGRGRGGVPRRSDRGAAAGQEQDPRGARRDEGRQGRVSRRRCLALPPPVHHRPAEDHPDGRPPERAHAVRRAADRHPALGSPSPRRLRGEGGRRAGQGGPRGAKTRSGHSASHAHRAGPGEGGGGAPAAPRLGDPLRLGPQGRAADALGAPHRGHAGEPRLSPRAGRGADGRRRAGPHRRQGEPSGSR